MLSRQNDHASESLKLLLTTPNSPVTILRSIISQLLQDALTNDTPGPSTRDLLMLVGQRHRDLLDETSAEFIKNDSSKQDALEQLLLSLSIVSRTSDNFVHLNLQFYSHSQQKQKTLMLF
jgi:hypothetical protein